MDANMAGLYHRGSAMVEEGRISRNVSTNQQEHMGFAESNTAAVNYGMNHGQAMISQHPWVIPSEYDTDGKKASMKRQRISVDSYPQNNLKDHLASIGHSNSDVGSGSESSQLSPLMEEAEVRARKTERQTRKMEEGLQATDGVTIPAKLRPGQVPDQGRPGRNVKHGNSELKKKCPICNRSLKDIRQVKIHFAPCVQRNGNPFGLHWNDVYLPWTVDASGRPYRPGTDQGDRAQSRPRKADQPLPKPGFSVFPARPDDEKRQSDLVGIENSRRHQLDSFNLRPSSRDNEQQSQPTSQASQHPKIPRSNPQTKQIRKVAHPAPIGRRRDGSQLEGKDSHVPRKPTFKRPILPKVARNSASSKRHALSHGSLLGMEEPNSQRRDVANLAYIAPNQERRNRETPGDNSLRHGIPPYAKSRTAHTPRYDFLNETQGSQDSIVQESDAHVSNLNNIGQDMLFLERQEKPIRGNSRLERPVPQNPRTHAINSQQHGFPNERPLEAPSEQPAIFRPANPVPGHGALWHPGNPAVVIPQNGLMNEASDPWMLNSRDGLVPGQPVPESQPLHRPLMQAPIVQTRASNPATLIAPIPKRPEGQSYHNIVSQPPVLRTPAPTSRLGDLPSETLVHLLQEWQRVALAEAQERANQNPEFQDLIKEMKARNLIDERWNWTPAWL